MGKDFSERTMRTRVMLQFCQRICDCSSIKFLEIPFAKALWPSPLTGVNQLGPPIRGQPSRLPSRCVRDGYGVLRNGRVAILDMRRFWYCFVFLDLLLSDFLAWIISLFVIRMNPAGIGYLFPTVVCREVGHGRFLFNGRLYACDIWLLSEFGA